MNTNMGTRLPSDQPSLTGWVKVLSAEVEELKSSLTGDMFQDMETKDKIHNLEMKINGVKPGSSEFECVGCGS